MAPLCIYPSSRVLHPLKHPRHVSMHILRWIHHAWVFYKHQAIIPLALSASFSHFCLSSQMITTSLSVSASHFCLSIHVINNTSYLSVPASHFFLLVHLISSNPSHLSGSASHFCVFSHNATNNSFQYQLRIFVFLFIWSALYHTFQDQLAFLCLPKQSATQQISQYCLRIFVSLLRWSTVSALSCSLFKHWIVDESESRGSVHTYTL